MQGEDWELIFEYGNTEVTRDFDQAAFVVRMLSCVWLFATLWTAAHQAPLSMGILQPRILEVMIFFFPNRKCYSMFDTNGNDY